MTFTAGQKILASYLSGLPALLGSTILNATTASITISVPTGYNHLHCVWTGRQDSGSGGAFALLRLNSDSGSNYTWQYVYGSGATATSANAGGLTSSIQIGVIAGSADTANYYGSGSFIVGNIASAVYKPVSGSFCGATNNAAGFAGSAGGLWQSTSAVTSVTLLPNSGNFLSNSSLTVYGLG